MGAAAGVAMAGGLASGGASALLGGKGGGGGGTPEVGYLEPPEWYKRTLRQQRRQGIREARRGGELALAEAGQGLITRGLGNTTVVNAVQRGIREDVRKGVRGARETFTLGMAAGMIPYEKQKSSFLPQALSGLGRSAGRYLGLQGLGGLKPAPGYEWDPSHLANTGGEPLLWNDFLM